MERTQFVGAIRVYLGLVLLVAAYLKWRNRQAFEAVVFLLSGWGRALYKSIANVAIIGETVLGLLLLAGIFPFWTAFGAALAVLVFDIALALLYTRGYDEGCACFGAADRGPIGLRQFTRNLVLTGTTGILLWLQIQEGRKTPIAAPSPIFFSGGAAAFSGGAAAFILSGLLYIAWSRQAAKQDEHTHKNNSNQFAFARERK